METKTLSDLEFRRAGEFLASARSNLGAGRFTAAAEDAFLAADRAAAGLLLLLGFEPRTHEGIVRLFGKEVVVPGLVEQRYGKMLSRLHEVRSKVVYGKTALPSPERTREAVRMAEEFVQRLQRARSAAGRR